MSQIRIRISSSCDNCGESIYTYWKAGGNTSGHVSRLKSKGWVIYSNGADNDYVTKCPKCKRGKRGGK